MRILVAQHEAGAGLGSLEQPLRRRDVEIDVWLPPLEAEPPDDPSAYDGLIALGGIAHPDQDAQHPWLETERSLLADALARGVPTLGICLGGQLLAQAAGATVGPIARPEIGWFRLELAPAARLDPLLGGLPSGFHVFEWHHYGFVPPPGTTALACTERSPQALRVGEDAWALQFHIEVDAEILAEWVRIGQDEIDRLGGGVEALRRETAERIAAYEACARDLADRFADRLERRAEAGGRLASQPAR